MNNPRPCPKCGSTVIVACTDGGALYETSTYAIECSGSCGTLLSDLPSNSSGRRRDVIAEWNRHLKITSEAMSKRRYKVQITDEVKKAVRKRARKLEASSWVVTIANYATPTKHLGHLGYFEGVTAIASFFGSDGMLLDECKVDDLL